MNTNVLQTLASSSPPSSSILIPLKPSATLTKQTQNLLTNSCHARPIGLRPINCTSGGSSDDSPTPPPAVPPRITPPDAVEIRFRRGSRRKRQQREGRGKDTQQPSKMQPKDWEDMSLNEKAMELYVGEKGLLFWLNKFAYASIFIMIGAWILFRFVGPSLNLYQLDAPPLSPSNVFKG